MLRHFYMALQAGDEPDSEARLSQIREGHHVDGVNLLFLEVQRLAAFGRWEAILDLSAFPDLLRLRRPAMVTDALIRAVYQSHLARFEVPAEPFAAARVFREEIAPRFGGLLATRHCRR